MCQTSCNGKGALYTIPFAPISIKLYVVSNNHNKHNKKQEDLREPILWFQIPFVLFPTEFSKF